MTNDSPAADQSRDSAPPNDYLVPSLETVHETDSVDEALEIVTDGVHNQLSFAQFVRDRVANIHAETNDAWGDVLDVAAAYEQDEISDTTARCRLDQIVKNARASETALLQFWNPDTE